ncbi:hypothetical protein AVEN_107412-1 [Araneus ventricosus]|uniref:Uncharacterized protein n=1 Tax=Araneus ventricosus TaxID=182803 RepID=A0A4Y2JAH8_ARAVE|nr:hypothetical protein AVEN_107412-1 [Araneus ventricosus]
MNLSTAKCGTVGHIVLMFNPLITLKHRNMVHCVRHCSPVHLFHPEGFGMLPFCARNWVTAVCVHDRNPSCNELKQLSEMRILMQALTTAVTGNTPTRRYSTLTHWDLIQYDTAKVSFSH